MSLKDLAERLKDRTPRGNPVGDEEIYQFAASCGFPFDRTISPSLGGVMWTGSRANVGGLSIENFLHELAHFLVASPADRRRVDFGLGSGPDSLSASKLQSQFGNQYLYDLAGKDSDDVDELEGEASLLGICLLFHFRRPTYETMLCHSWIDFNAPLVPGILLRLQEQGLLSEDGSLNLDWIREVGRE